MEISSKLLEILSNAKRVVVLTGAGVSAESGIKTFRDHDGLWTKLNPAELASMDGFMKNPKVVWSWYQHRREIINNTKPNPGHLAIAEMQDMFPNFDLITQNVDRLHQSAGSGKVIELHGNIIENHCLLCKTLFYGEINLQDNTLPKCQQCGGYIRPSVVWFGEMLPERALKEAEKAAMNCNVFFSVGTSAEVYPAANLPMLAKGAGAYVVEINPNKTVLSMHCDEHLEAPSGVALPLLLEEYKRLKIV
jgi:NAD-dependent deacetylase